MRILELFSCSGGMADGLRRAGLKPTMAFDYDADACASYAANLGHAPVRMDARDLLRMAQDGWSPGPVDLFVADPPCTPWSRAGKRQGESDERDMLADTVELVRLLRPRRFLIANVPGLDDGPNWPVVQRTIGSLAAAGYCIDFARFDAADYGVPQRRIRPFWFGHHAQCGYAGGGDHDGSHIAWPTRTHGPPAMAAAATLFAERLRPWVTCRQALEHLPPEQLGRPIRLRWRGQNGAQQGSVPDAPARVVGTSNLSDGNVLASPEAAFSKVARRRRPSKKPRASTLDAPAGVVTASENGDGNELVVGGPMSEPSRADRPARTIRGAARGQQTMVDVPHHPPSQIDEPSRTVRASSGTSDKILACGAHRPSNPDAPARTLTGNEFSDGALLGNAMQGGQGEALLEWPLDRTSTVIHERDVIAPPGHHNGSNFSGPNAVKLSEAAAAILQGFPQRWVFSGKTKSSRWAQIGMAMPPPLAEAVGRSIARHMGLPPAAAADETGHPHIAKAGAGQCPLCLGKHAPHCAPELP